MERVKNNTEGREGRRNGRAKASSQPGSSGIVSRKSQSDVEEKNDKYDEPTTSSTAKTAQLERQRSSSPMAIDHEEARPRRGMKGIPALRPLSSTIAIASDRQNVHNLSMDDAAQDSSSDQDDDDELPEELGDADKTTGQVPRSRTQQSGDPRLQLLQDQELEATSMPYLRRRIEAAVRGNTTGG